MHQTVHAPDPTNDCSTSARNTRCPPLSALDLHDGELRHPTNHYPTSANSTWCYICGALILWAKYQLSIIHDVSGMSNIPTRKLRGRHKKIQNLQYHCWHGFVISISQQIYTHDFPGKKSNFIPFGNSIPVVNDKLLSREQAFAKRSCW